MKRHDRDAMPILSVDALHASHGRVMVVDDVSFALDRGACLAIVGESGSGKTTIARCVAGLHAADERQHPTRRRAPGGARALANA